MTSKTLASTGQSKYTAGYSLGSEGDLTNTGVTLINHGTIGAFATQWGVEIWGNANTVINYGFIEPSATTSPAGGVVFSAGSGDVMYNKLGATLSSSMGAGFYTASNSAGRAVNATLINAGVILGTVAYSVGLGTQYHSAVIMFDSGIVTNLSSGTIETNGISFYSGVANMATATSNVSLVNSGTVLGGTKYGAVYMLNGGNLTNLAGTLSGDTAGMYGVEIKNVGGLNTPSTITNAATIEGGSGGAAIIMASSVVGNRVIDQSGGVFIGAVDGGANATMELASTASTGVLTTTGGQFTHFSALNIDAGARWTIAGDTGLAAAFPVIGGLAAGDTISLSGLLQTPTTFVSSVTTVSGTIETKITIKASAMALETLTLLGSIASTGFVFVPGSTSTLAPLACFVTGTRIATPEGCRPVEALRVGDLIRTQSGEARPIRWIGHRSIDPRRHPKPELVRPLRIAAGAFGPGRPERALFVSADHGICLHGLDAGAPVLVPAGLLANGDSIAPVDLGLITYWHIELDTHDVILAEGLPVESYLDSANRENFDSDTAPVRLHADFSPPSNAWLWEASGCLRLVQTGPLLAAARRQLRRDTFAPAAITVHA
jgi:collagen type I/II/III/V/XI/XXIV/XXVII alpha